MADHGKTTETTRDSGKLPKSLNIADVLKWAKGNPMVLAAIALGSGTGGQELLSRIGQTVEWWQIALAVVGYGLMQYLADSAKRNDEFRKEIRADIADIKGSLREGTAEFQNIKEDVKSLHQWRHELTAEAIKRGIDKHRAKSKPAMRPYPGEAVE